MKDSKKKAAKGTPRRLTVRQRAGLMIAESDDYDADTRTALYNALEGDNQAMLAELVRRAWNGETILDLTSQTDDAPAAELKDFAHHLTEAIRIARDSETLPNSLYNDLAEAWCDFENRMPSLARLSESEEYMHLALTTYAKQIKERAKGGAK